MIQAASPRGPRRGDRRPPPIPWTHAEPDRLRRDRAEIGAFAPLLAYRGPEATDGVAESHGGWVGELPRWPFDRARPDRLDELIGEHGLKVVVMYSPAYPMVPPVIYPVDPEPLLDEQTQTAWHVAPGGSLCLLQSLGAWRPEASITELLAKAAGWRVEYALTKGGVIDAMSTNGIVSDDSWDHLIARAVELTDAQSAETTTVGDAQR